MFTNFKRWYININKLHTKVNRENALMFMVNGTSGGAIVISGNKSDQNWYIFSIPFRIIGTNKINIYILITAILEWQYIVLYNFILWST